MKTLNNYIKERLTTNKDKIFGDFEDIYQDLKKLYIFEFVKVNKTYVMKIDTIDLKNIRLVAKNIYLISGNGLYTPARFDNNQMFLDPNYNILYNYYGYEKTFHFFLGCPEQYVEYFLSFCEDVIKNINLNKSNVSSNSSFESPKYSIEEICKNYLKIDLDGFNLEHDIMNTQYEFFNSLDEINKIIKSIK